MFILLSYIILLALTELLLIYDRSVQLEGSVTSVALRGEGQQIFVATETAQIYTLGYTDFKPELIATNHNSAVKDVAFPL